MNGISRLPQRTLSHRHGLRILLLPITCATLALLLLSLPPLGARAFGAEGELGPVPIVREYTYDPRRDTPDVEQRITDEAGTVYLLKEISNPIPGPGIPEKQFTATVQRPITPEMESQGSAAARSVFAEELMLDVGEYAGVLRIRSLTTEPVYRSVEEQVEHTVVYSDLATVDVLQLPEYETFTVSDDGDFDATVSKTLRRVAVSWETTGFDGDGRPALHEATVVFRGTQRQLVLDYHVATATYSGSLPAKSYEETVFATYAPEAAPALQREPEIRPLSMTDSVTVSEPLAPLSAPVLISVPLLIATAGALIVLLVLLPVLYFFLYHNARLVSVSAVGRTKVLVRKRLRVVEGEAVFRIDPSLNLFREGEKHLILLNRGLAARPGDLVVLWGELRILRVALRRDTDISRELVYALGRDAFSSTQEGAQVALRLSGEDA
jgi:hypothetical protein